MRLLISRQMTQELCLHECGSLSCGVEQRFSGGRQADKVSAAIGGVDGAIDQAALTQHICHTDDSCGVESNSTRQLRLRLRPKLAQCREEVVLIRTEVEVSHRGPEQRLRPIPQFYAEVRHVTGQRRGAIGRTSLLFWHANTLAVAIMANCVNCILQSLRIAHTLVS